MYEIVRTIYSNTAVDATDASRISVLQQTLSQLRLTNIATLDACMNHFTRLIDLTSADEDYVVSLTSTMSRCILRPKTETSLTMEEKHATRLVRDLFNHKDAIFNELKRMSTLSHSSSIGGGAGRPRAISTDESNRKALVEERNRALLEKATASRSRATSPAPGLRGHRRDRSSGGPETRFPIQTSPQSDRQRTSMGSLNVAMKRASLEVPGGDDSPESANGTSPITGHDRTDSKGGAKFVAGRRVPTSPPDDASPRGVSLEDKPMESPRRVSLADESLDAARGVSLEDKPMDD